MYETQGKAANALAYCFAVYDTDPYLLVNYTPELRSVFILAHELGHAMHSLYANETQPRIYGGYQFAVSEFPSNLHEVLLTRHLVQNIDDRAVRLHALDTALRRFEDMFYRHAMLAAFSHDAHVRVAEGTPLTAAALEDRFSALLDEFQAPVSQDELAGHTWLGDPQAHRLYLSYPYVLGRACAHTVATDLVSGETAPETYLDFLRAGASAYPVELLADLDIEPRTPAPYEQAVTEFEGYLDTVES